MGIRGIRKVASVDIPVYGANDLMISEEQLQARVQRQDYFVPELGEGAQMLEGDTDEIIEQLIDMLKAKGGIK